MPLQSLIDPDQVRAVIDLSLTWNDLPDDVIQLAVHSGKAINELLLLDPQAEAHNEDGHIGLALNYLVAALIVENDSLPFLTQESYGQQGGYTRQAVDRTAKARMLRSRVTDEVNVALGVTVTADTDRPTFFALASGTRGL